MLEVIKGQCIGDLNTDYRIDQNALSIFSDYLLSANDTIINNADIDYNNSLDIFDLISIINQITNNDLMWCEFENVDLSVEWEEQGNSSYYNIKKDVKPTAPLSFQTIVQLLRFPPSRPGRARSLALKF